MERGKSRALHLFFSHLLNYRRGGIAVSEGDAHDPTSSSLNDLTTHDLIRCPVGTFDQHIGLEPLDDPLRSVFVEYDDSIDRGERVDDFRAIAFNIDRTRRSLDCADGPIGIDPDNQRIALLSSRVQIPNVARMEHIEHTVGEDDGTATLP